MYRIGTMYGIALIATPIIILTKVIIMPAIIQYMIRLMIGLLIGNGCAHVNSIDARYRISISIIIVQYMLYQGIVIPLPSCRYSDYYKTD